MTTEQVDQQAFDELADEISQTLGLPAPSVGEDTTTPSTDEETEETQTEELIEEEDEDLDESFEDDEETQDVEETGEEDEGKTPAELTQLTAQIKALEERLAELSKSKEEPAPKEEPREPEPEVVPEPPTFVDEESMTDMLSDPKALNAAISRAAKWGFEEAMKAMKKADGATLEQARQAMRSELPKSIKQVLAAEQQENTIRTQFWNRNDDTMKDVSEAVQAQRRGIAASIAKEVLADNPNLTASQLVDAVEKRYRAALGFGKPQNGKPKRERERGPKKPRHGSSSSRRPSGGIGQPKTVESNSPEDIAATMGIL